MKNDRSDLSGTVNQQRAGEVIDDIWSTFPNVHLRVLTAEKESVEIQICDCGMSGQCRPQGWARIEKHNRQRLANAIAAAPVAAGGDDGGYRVGVEDACRAICSRCADTDKWGKAALTEGSMRFWHGAYPCDATPIRTTFAAALRTPEGEEK